MERKPSLKMMYFFCFTFSAYCVVAKDALSKQISIAFLERVKADFKKRYGGGKASTAIPKSLNKEFGYLPHNPLDFLGTVMSRCERFRS